MNRTAKRIGLGVGGLLALVLLGGGGFAFAQKSAFEKSMARTYDVPVPSPVIEASEERLARGEHLSKSLAGCSISECHGADLAGGKTIEMGPLGTVTGPNITGAALGAVYSDGELLRLLQHGVKKDGRSVRFMTVQEFGWLPEEDLLSVIAYVRSVPEKKKPAGPMEIGLLGKILDRQGAVHLDVARKIDHSRREEVPDPEPTARYGQFIARMCVGCHGDNYSGGPIPGAPPELPTPTNITPHPSGIQEWTFEDFNRLLDEGVKKGGEKLNLFMPLSALSEMNAVERRALWEYLRSLKPREFGNR